MKSLKAMFYIALAFVSLILITAIITMRTEVLSEREALADEGLINALNIGIADQVSSYFSPDINFFSPGGPIFTDSTKATIALKSFFGDHQVKRFDKEGVMPGNVANLSYLKGVLHTEDKDFILYATIYGGKVERLDINVLNNSGF